MQDDKSNKSKSIKEELSLFTAKSKFWCVLKKWKRTAKYET